MGRSVAALPTASPIEAGALKVRPVDCETLESVATAERNRGLQFHALTSMINTHPNTLCLLNDRPSCGTAFDGGSVGARGLLTS